MPFVLEPLTAESGFELTPEKPQEFELTPLDKPQAVAGYEQPPETWYGDLGRRFAEGAYKLEADIYSLAGRGLKTVGAEDTGQQFLDEAAKLEGTSLGTEPVSMEGLYGAWKAGDTLGVAKEIGRLGPKVVAGSLPMMIAAGVNGPAFYALLAEDMAREQAKNSGRVDPEWGDYATAAPFAVISGALERWGLKGLINAGRASGASLTTLRGIAQVAKEVGKATGKEIGTEMIQEPTEYVGETIGTQLPPTLAGAGERSLMGGIGGLFGGGAVSAVATPINMAAQRRNATEIPELELIREGDLMPQQPEVPPAENLLGWPASVSGFEAPPGADLSTPEGRQAAVDITLSTEEFTDLSTRAKAAVTQELDRLGLKDFDVQTVDRLFTLSGDQTDAEYQNRIFRVALDTPLAELPSVMNHEVIHALKEMGAFTKEQWTILERAATQRSSMDPVRLQQYMRAYVKQGMTRAQAFEIINEEAVGDMHREFHDGRLKPMGTLKKALQRIDQFFEATGNGLRGLGFTSSAGIMEAIQAGKFGVSANQQLTGPTRYNLRQQQTPEFKNWFKRSTVVDEAGSPMVVYHGTDAGDNFSTFGQFSHFGTQEQAHRRLYSKMGSVDDNIAAEIPGRLMPVYLNLQNPLTVEDADNSRAKDLIRTETPSRPYKGWLDPRFWEYELFRATGKHPGWIPSDFVSIKNSNFVRMFDRLVKQGFTETQALITLLQKRGYDGARYTNKFEGPGFSYLSFSPTQVKSAVGNAGTFNPRSPDVRYSLRQHAPAKMYSALERMVEGVKQARMPGLQWLQFIQSNAPKFGVKEPEIQWTLTRQFLAERAKQPVTKEELLQHLRANAVRTSVVGGRYDSGLINSLDVYGGLGMVEDPVRGWTMPGLTDRGAILIEDVSRPYFRNVKSHYFTQRGTIGWVRYGLGTTAQGEPVLFIDEVQSDWGQSRREGQLVDLDSDAWRVVEVPVDSVLDQIVESRIESRISTDDTLDALGWTSTDLPTRPTTLEEREAMREPYREQLVQEIREDLGLFSSDRRIHYYLVQGATGEVISEAHSFIRGLVNAEGDIIASSGIFARDPDHAKARIYEAQQRLMRSNASGMRIYPAGPYVTDTSLWVRRLIKEVVSMAIDNGVGVVAWTNGNDQMKRSSTLPQKQLEGLGKFYDETLPQLIASALKPYGIKLDTVNLQNLQDGSSSQNRRSYASAFWGGETREGSQYKEALRFLEAESAKVSRAVITAGGRPKIPVDPYDIDLGGALSREDAEAYIKAAFTDAHLRDLRASIDDLISVIDDVSYNTNIPAGSNLADVVLAKILQHYETAFVREGVSQSVELKHVYNAIAVGKDPYESQARAQHYLDKAKRDANVKTRRAFAELVSTLELQYTDNQGAGDPVPSVDERTGFRITSKLAEDVEKNGWTKFSIRRAANRQTTTNPQVAQQMYERLNRIYGTKLDAARLGKETARFNWFMKNILTLPQVERENWDVPGVRPFVDAARRWWGTKGQWVADWDQWIAKVRNSGYGKAEQSKLWRFANEVTVLSDELGRRLTTAELANEARKVGGLDAGLMELWTSGRAMLQEALNTLEELARARVTSTWNDRILQQQDIVLRLEMEKARDKALKALEDDFQKMRNRDYWPLARFGEYTVNVVAKVPLRYMGKEFKPGQTVLFELYETEGEQASRKAALLKAHPRKLDIAAGKVDESLYSFMGLPPSVLRMLESELSSVAQDYLVGDQAIDAETMKMLQEQLNALRTVMLHFTPENAFKQRLLRRKGTRGFTDDGLRAMASLGQSFAGHIARAQHRGEMDDALKTLDMHRREMEFATDPALAGQGNKLTDLLNFFRRAQRDMMNPGNDLANLRALGFLWYLGAVPRAAFVQVWQPFATTYPWLASRYGDATAVAEMGKAYRDFIKLFKGKGGGLPIHLEEAVALGMKMGFLNQSLFTELAGVAEGSNLQRLLPGKFLKSQEAASVIRRAGYYSSLLFQKGEELNRLVTFKAVYMAELRKVLGMEANTEEQIATKMQQLAGSQQGKDAMSQAFLAARTAVESTQGEYARWARPELMRGKKSAIFLFKMYSQLMNYFAIRDPGKWRFLAIQLSVAGALGLPFAEDLLDILNAATQGAMCKTGDIRDCVREYVSELGANPELVMHGGSRYLGPWDLSANMSLGSVVPGVEPLTKAMMPGGDLRDQSLRLQTEALGALFAIPLNFAKALSTGQERDFEQAMPTIVRDVYRTIRRAREGGEVSRSGEMLVPVDWSDPGDVVTHLGEAIGFRSNEMTAMRDMRWSQKEAAKYWGGRREAVVGQFYHLYKTEGTPDREALADVIKAVTDFNASVPYPEMAISGAQLKKGLRASIQRQKRGEAGIAPEKKYRRLYSEVAEGFAY